MAKYPILGREEITLGDINDITGTITDKGSKTGPYATRLTDGTNFYVATKDSQLPASLTASGNLKTAILEALPSGTNTIGKVDIASALPAGNNNIGNVDVVSLPSIPSGSNIIGAVKKDKVNYTIVNKHVSSSDATSGVTVWDPTAGKKWVVTDLIISTDTAMTVTIKDGTTAILVLYLAANGGAVSNFQTPLQSSTADNNLTVTASAAGNIAVTATGYEV